MENKGPTADKREAIPIGHTETVLDDATKKYIDHVDDILEDIHQNNPSLQFAERLKLQKEAVDTLIGEWELLLTASDTPDEGLKLAISYAKERLAAMNVLETRVEPRIS